LRENLNSNNKAPTVKKMLLLKLNSKNSLFCPGKKLHLLMPVLCTFLKKLSLKMACYISWIIFPPGKTRFATPAG